MLLLLWSVWHGASAGLPPPSCPANPGFRESRFGWGRLPSFCFHPAGMIEDASQPPAAWHRQSRPTWTRSRSTSAWAARNWLGSTTAVTASENCPLQRPGSDVFLLSEPPRR